MTWKLHSGCSLGFLFLFPLMIFQRHRWNFSSFDKILFASQSEPEENMHQKSDMQDIILLLPEWWGPVLASRYGVIQALKFALFVAGYDLFVQAKFEKMLNL